MKNYYKIMGLKVTATENEIKSAYRLLAKRYHPDVNPGNATAAEKFADLTEAYEVLSDAEKKTEYDRQVSELMAQRAAQNSAYSQPYSSFSQNPYAQPYARRQFTAAQVQQQAQQQMYQRITEAQRNGYNKGYESGFNDAQGKFSAENEQLRAQVTALKNNAAETRLKAENDRLKKKLDDVEADLEALRLKSADEEEQLKVRLSRLEADNERLRAEQAGKAKRTASDSSLIKSLREKLAQAEKNGDEVKRALALAEKKLDEAQGKLLKQTTAVSDLKLENSRVSSEKRYYEEEYNKAKNLAGQLEEEVALLNQTVAGWEEFSRSLDTAEAMKSLKSEWDKRVRDAKKRIKDTYYGTLGVVYYCGVEEIKESFRKLVKRYQKKAESDKSFEEKLLALNEAFKTLSDEQKRAEYDESIGITKEEVAAMLEEKRKHEETMERLEQEQGEQEFWAYVEELMYNAQIGDSESQNALGEMYYYGDELEKDLEQAVYWFKEAAKQKYPDAFYNLGVCFLTGEGVEKDEEKAKGFIKQAAKLGNVSAQELIKADYVLYSNAEPAAAEA